MKDFFTKLLTKIKAVWASWAVKQKLIFGGVVLAFLVAVVMVAGLYVRPPHAAIFGAPLTDESLRDRILIRLDTEGISYSLSANGTIINVENQQTARRARAILVREGLTPQNLDPWHLFDVNRWTTNQFLDNVNLQRSLTESLRQHIESLNDIDQAMVNLAVPRDRLFLQDQDPITVSVVITARPGSDITTNMHKIRGLNDLIQFAIPGLQADNITITDSFTGRRINDFAAYDIQSRLEQADIIRRQKEAEERDYLNRFRRQLSGMLSPDRIGFVNIEITNNTNQITRTGREITPIEITPQDPTAPFNTREVVHSILISEGAANVTFRGTGFNPEGPAGFEAQTPPAYQDLQNTTGFYDQSTFQRNFDTNVTEFEEIVSPSRRENIAVSVALDGTWTFDLNEDGTPVMLPDGSRSRTYHPIPAAELAQFQSLLEAAVNFDLASGDMVRVVNIQFDRTAQFMMEDEAFRRQLLVGNIIRFGGFGLLGLAVLFIAYRLVVRERERRRRAREEELARQHAAMREAALRSLEQEQAEAEINPIDQARATAQDHAMAMAREHPEEVAQLIKTWLSEES